MPSAVPAALAYEIKSADLPLVAFHLRSSDMHAVAQALEQQLKSSPGFFDQEPVLIDLEGLASEGPMPDLPVLIQLLQSHGMRPVAVKTQQASWLEKARQCGLVQGEDARVRRQPAPTAAPAAQPTPVMSSLADAMVLDRPLRSGQQVYAKHRDLIVLAMVNPGAEVIADGHVHVYAPLRGKAIAGARGFQGARIFAQHMDPELISIAGVYRTSENPLPAAVRGLPAQVFLQVGADGEKLSIIPLGG